MRLLVVEQRFLHRYRDLPPEVIKQVGARIHTHAATPASSEPRDLTGEDRSLAMASAEEGKAETEAPIPAPADENETIAHADHLSSWGVLLGLLTSRRGMTGFAATFLFGTIVAVFDATWALPPFVRHGVD